jgi:hypothetical protein
MLFSVVMYRLLSKFVGKVTHFFSNGSGFSEKRFSGFFGVARRVKDEGRRVLKKKAAGFEKKEPGFAQK